jgi:lipopolysaccharide export system protein LptA
MSARLPLLLAAAAAGVLAAAMPSSAAAPAAKRGTCPQSALKGHNSDAPVDWNAERIEVQDQQGRAILTGNVVAKQAELTLTASRVVAAYSKRPSTHVDRLDASGGVVIRGPGETARGAFGIYDLNQKIITMVGSVTLTRCDATVSGARLVYDLNTGRAVMDGGGVPGSSNPGGRVTGSFTVTQSKSGTARTP